ncbi:tRNA-specific adenosine deaminase [Kribbella sp. ALI-6-A]|uniref:nucleoside deaminase n=1 Tax=Kribbella sp. ALI-6-A TaxID=1933817 RepID=UPI00097C0B5C|nr:nucleoside deaminase [Kribbella sp. ALI-6-A]ONI69097.1 tRNA-specific adenosine deaminase [Kribbella sp. ALI-6-A]
MTTDEDFLRRAIALSSDAITSGNPPFGSLLVGPDGTVLAEDHNTSITENDISAHPELKLARWAAANLDAETAAGTTMYTSCQPCGMCAGALERSGLGRVVYAMSGDQVNALKPGGGFLPVPSEGPLLPEEASAVAAEYYKS